MDKYEETSSKCDDLTDAIDKALYNAEIVNRREHLF